MCFLITFSVNGQNDKGYFLVEFDAFTPPTKDLIASLENTEATPFLAPDVLGTEQFLGDYKGKKVVIWFWSTADGISTSQIDQLNLLQSRYREELQVISFAEESKTELLDFRRSYPIDFPIIPNGKILGEAAFGGDLGLGRLFLIDANGVIQKVIPREAFESNATTAFKYAEDMLKSL
jgi:peroxiredoxin